MTMRDAYSRANGTRIDAAAGGGIPGSFACDPVSAEFPGDRPRDRDDRRVESGHLIPRDVDGCEAVLPLGGSVANSKTMLAVVLAAATLVVFVVVIAMGGALRAGLAPWPGTGIAVLAGCSSSGGWQPQTRHEQRQGGLAIPGRSWGRAA